MFTSTPECRTLCVFCKETHQGTYCYRSFLGTELRARGCVSNLRASASCLMAVWTSSKPNELAAYLASFCASLTAAKSGPKPGAVSAMTPVVRASRWVGAKYLPHIDTATRVKGHTGLHTKSTKGDMYCSTWQSGVMRRCALLDC